MTGGRARPWTCWPNSCGSRPRGAQTVFTADDRHVDALADAVGYDKLAAMVATVHAHYLGFTIERASGIDRHGDQLRFT